MTTGLQRAAGSTVIDAVTSTDVTGLVAGTPVMTMEGELPVEFLSPGDRVISREGLAVLREIRVSEVEVAPIRIKAGSLGHTRPESDVTVVPGAQLLIRDWRAKVIFGADEAHVPARRLIDGEFVAETRKRTLRVIDLVFDRQHVIYAGGLEVATAAV